MKKIKWKMIKAVCECGKEVQARSEKHLAWALDTHKKSKLHKELMKNKKEAEKVLAANQLPRNLEISNETG